MLTAYHFRFTCEVLTPLALDEHSGASLRGNLFEAIWKRFCTNKSAPTCADCPLHTICPVSALVAPLREENPRGRDIPRPYLIMPPLEGARTFNPGETFTFGLTLFGSIIQLLPYLVMASNTFGEIGLGRRIPDVEGQRGRFRVQRIEATHPLTGASQELYWHGKPLVQAPTLAITSSDVAARAAILPQESITLHFLTPTRLIEDGRLVHRLTFRTLISRISERFIALATTYGEEPVSVEEMRIARGRLLDRAVSIVCQKDETRWEEVKSFSRRQQRFTPIGGLLGSITFSGDLTPFHELLTWGEVIHVGKNVVKGSGWYQLAQPLQPAHPPAV